MTVPAVSRDAAPVETTTEHGRSGSSVGSNAMWLIGGRVAVALLGWGATVLIARELTPERFGQFSLVFTILGMMSIITDLGVGRIAVAALLEPDENAPRFAGTYIVLRVALGVLGYATAMAIVAVAGYPSEVVAAMAIAGLVVVFATPAHAYDVAFQVRERLSPIAVAEVVGQLGQIAFIAALVLNGGTLIWLVVPAVAKDAAILAWKVPAAHRLHGFSYRVDIAIWRDLLREALPLSLGAAFVTIYFRIDSVMLSKLDSFESVGLYAVAYKFVGLLHFVPSALAVALLAPLTAAWTTDKDRFVAEITRGALLLSLACAGALVVFVPFAGDVAALLYSETYRDAGTATAVLVVAECFGFVSVLAITGLIAAGRHRVYPFITAGGLALNLAMNLVLIPRWSIEGAAVATLVTEIAVGLALWMRLRRLGVGGSVVSDRVMLATLLGLGAAAGAGVALPWVAAMSLGLAALAGALVVGGVLDRDLFGRSGVAS